MEYDGTSCKELARNLKNKDGRIDIIKLAHLLNIKVYSTDEIKEAAFIAYDNNSKSYKIYVNSNEARTRQRFSIAHEIAHFLLHKNKIRERVVTSKQNTCSLMQKIANLFHEDKVSEIAIIGRQNEFSLSAEEEKAADALAEELLMPTDCVKDFLRENDVRDEPTKITDDVISKISEEFEVSNPVSRIRLRDMKYYVRFA